LTGTGRVHSLAVPAAPHHHDRSSSQQREEPEVPDDEQKTDRTGAEGERAPGEAEPEQDRFRPEAIAARVAGLGEEGSDIDRIAEEEERKLAERRRQSKGKGKRGLEAAASRRLASIGEAKVKRPSAIAEAVAPDADPLLERAAHLSRWIKQHTRLFAALVAVAVLGGGGLLGWVYWQNERDAKASALLAQAFADEHGHVSAKADDDDEQQGAHKALYPTFKSAAERRDAAIAKYREVEAKYPGTGAAMLARLSEAGLLLDQGDARGAADAYEQVKSSPLGRADLEVRGRALEGIGFADEQLAQTDAANKDKHLDDALAAYKELEQVDMKGFKELGMYHEARVLLAKGDKAKAIDLLKDVYKRVTEPGDSHPFSYLELVVQDRLRDLDPSAIPPRPTMGGPGGNLDMNDPRIQQLLEQLQQQARQKGGAPAVPAPGPK
jgi:hypothetical protein